MAIKVIGKLIETDEEGFLLDAKDWDSDVMNALIKQHEDGGHKPTAVPLNRKKIARFHNSFRYNGFTTTR